MDEISVPTQLENTFDRDRFLEGDLHQKFAYIV